MKKCMVCGGQGERTEIHGYVRPDKYETWVGISGIKRLWVRCKDCGFHWQLRNYPIERLEKIYERGYRDKEFRGESIEEAYKRIVELPHSENVERYVWFASHIKWKDSKNVLDIGSGLGVWPAILSDAEYHVTCVDTNIISAGFIANTLDMPCYYDLEDVDGEFDVVSLVHVLEHITDLSGFLQQVRKRTRVGGHLFVEVPDKIGFKSLPKDHDDFNSCHVWSFGVNSLASVMVKNGFRVVAARCVKYSGRGLSRVLMLCS